MRLKKHNEDEHKYKNQFKCNDCRFIAKSIEELDKHIANHHHTNHTNSESEYTLMVTDSHVKTLNLRKVEAVIGGRLFTPGVTRPKEGRAYNSTRSWHNARFPDNNLTDKVPELLGARQYVNMIVQAPCNDISNLDL